MRDTPKGALWVPHRRSGQREGLQHDHEVGVGVSVQGRGVRGRGRRVSDSVDSYLYSVYSCSTRSFT